MILIRLLKLVVILQLISFCSFASERKGERSGEWSYGSAGGNAGYRLQDASMATLRDCENAGYFKKVRQVGEFTKRELLNRPGAYGSIGDMGGSVAQATLVGYGNLAISCAHCILKKDGAGLKENLKEPIIFYSYDMEKYVEVDLEKSKFGCRKSWKSKPSYLEIDKKEKPEEYAYKRSECDWAVLVLKENMVRKYGNDFMPIDWLFDVSKEVWDKKKENLKLHSISDNKEGYGIFVEGKCSDKKGVLDLTGYEVVANHCDSYESDSGSPYVFYDQETSSTNIMGILLSANPVIEENYVRLFTGEFFKAFKDKYELEKNKRSNRSI